MVTTCSICGTTEAVDPGGNSSNVITGVLWKRENAATIVLFGLIIWIYIRMTQNGWL